MNNFEIQIHTKKDTTARFSAKGVASYTLNAICLAFRVGNKNEYTGLIGKCSPGRCSTCLVNSIDKTEEQCAEDLKDFLSQVKDKFEEANDGTFNRK